MTIPIMNCEQFTCGLADFLERDDDESTRAGMKAHALSCAECGALLADLQTLRADAASLPELVPSRDLWAGIAIRIETPVVEWKHAGSATAAHGGTKRRPRLWAGLAAAGLVAVTGTVTQEAISRAVIVNSSAGASEQPRELTRTTVPAAKPDSIPVQAVASIEAATPLTRQPIARRARISLAANRPGVQRTYETEIADVRTVLNQRRPQLDSATVAVVEFNLGVIDTAIAQCKQALRTNPASQFLMQSLDDAMNKKVQLLRTAAALPSRM